MVQEHLSVLESGQQALNLKIGFSLPSPVLSHSLNLYLVLGLCFLLTTLTIFILKNRGAWKSTKIVIVGVVAKFALVREHHVGTDV